MDGKRFPTDWACAEIVKQYLCGQCKTKRHRHQVDATSDNNGINQEDEGGDELKREKENNQHEKGGDEGGQFGGGEGRL